MPDPSPVPPPAAGPIPTPPIPDPTPPPPTPKPKKRKPGRPKEPKRPCAVKGCRRHARAKGLCWAHYKRALRNGGPGRPRIARHAGDLVSADVLLPLGAWERLAGQGAPFSEVARAVLMRAAARLPVPTVRPLRSTASPEERTVAIDDALERLLTAAFSSTENTTTTPHHSSQHFL